MPEWMEDLMLFRSFGLCVPIMLLSFQAVSSANEIEYSLSNLGSGEYEYVYTIYNDVPLSDGSGTNLPVQLFDIAFDSTLYENPTFVTPNPLASQWSQGFLAAVGAVPVQYDVLASDLGIPAGTDVSGFAVEFTWLGGGLPGNQLFQIYDPNTSPYTLLLSGETANIAPEPSTFGMLVIAVAYGARKIRRKYA